MLSGINHKLPAPRNRTLALTEADRVHLRPRLIRDVPTDRRLEPVTGTICGDCLRWAEVLPPAHVDLLILDPPYNLTKTMGEQSFKRQQTTQYSRWFVQVIDLLRPLLKDTATIYICSDWLTSHSVYEVASNFFYVRNRITWEREKGRGAERNWKNCAEDIWFCTVSNEYTFNPEHVLLRRRVIAPYRNADGLPKDWVTASWGSFRDTYPSNLWTDITIPFWSMPENTNHPTQKSEKLVAKLILASTNTRDFVLDPFVGSGTTSVVASKLNRRYLGIEIDEEYCLLTERRLEAAAQNRSIQGLADGVFWERNSLNMQRAKLTAENGSSRARPVR